MLLLGQNLSNVVFVYGFKNSLFIFRHGFPQEFSFCTVCCEESGILKTNIFVFLVQLMCYPPSFWIFAIHSKYFLSYFNLLCKFPLRLKWIFIQQYVANTKITTLNYLNQSLHTPLDTYCPQKQNKWIRMFLHHFFLDGTRNTVSNKLLLACHF